MLAVVGDVAIALSDQRFTNGGIRGTDFIDHGPGKRAFMHLQSEILRPTRHLGQAVQDQFLGVQGGRVLEVQSLIGTHQAVFLLEKPGFFFQTQGNASLFKVNDFTGCGRANDFVGR